MSLLKRIGGATPPPVEPTVSRSPVRPETGRIAPVGVPNTEDTFRELRARVQDRLINELNSQIDLNNQAKVRKQVEEIFNSILDSESIVLSRAERQRLFESITADIIGLGPLEPLLADDDVSEIMVNGPKQVYIEKKGKLIKTDITFADDDHVMRIIDRIVAPLGRRVDESSPMVDARLKDGSRVNVVIRPLALNGPTITIRKFRKDKLTVQDLVRFGSMSQDMADFLAACVQARLNIVVAGGTGSGKTTLLNVLSSFIPEDERIITVENAAELQLRQEHVVTLESRPPNVEGKGEVTIRDLVINCLRMRPERIIVGECRGGETLDMLQAMNTGHDGSMTTIHANSPRDAVSRIETMCLMAGMDLPARAIREQIASAIHVFVQQSRLKDGSRKVTQITEVAGMEGDVVVLQDIFVFEQTGIDEKGKIVGHLRPTGVRPRFLEKFEALNIFLPPTIFGASERFSF
ncbi:MULTISPECIES: CpaF family protein [Chloroflexus]|uniref:Type II secretion system protein E n=1 Tax=Chloroflexus aggregans (strain MD-66 / DSM 9485) TaxID=326427 RepID=B8G7N3_CHLAD|nr:MULTISPECIES: CpaF family protein [Chloroflexus]ACL26068.1 type II secretion system protein E [Chloroflexus aggregans DSM 9485]GIV87579.1 MAG: type II secretion system protein E [Chloroflexus sp.]